MVLTRVIVFTRVMVLTHIIISQCYSVSLCYGVVLCYGVNSWVTRPECRTHKEQSQSGGGGGKGSLQQLQKFIRFGKSLNSFYSLEYFIWLKTAQCIFIYKIIVRKSGSPTHLLDFQVRLGLCLGNHYQTKILFSNNSRDIDRWRHFIWQEIVR